MGMNLKTATLVAGLFAANLVGIVSNNAYAQDKEVKNDTTLTIDDDQRVEGYRLVSLENYLEEDGTILTRPRSRSGERRVIVDMNTREAFFESDTDREIIGKDSRFAEMLRTTTPESMEEEMVYAAENYKGDNPNAYMSVEASGAVVMKLEKGFEVRENIRMDIIKAAQKNLSATPGTPSPVRASPSGP